MTCVAFFTWFEDINLGLVKTVKGAFTQRGHEKKGASTHIVTTFYDKCIFKIILINACNAFQCVFTLVIQNKLGLAKGS